MRNFFLKVLPLAGYWVALSVWLDALDSMAKAVKLMPYLDIVLR